MLKRETKQNKAGWKLINVTRADREVKTQDTDTPTLGVLPSVFQQILHRPREEKGRVLWFDGSGTAREELNK